MEKVPIIYDVSMNKVAYLENATTVGYEQPMNGLWSANFTLPANDPKNDHCLPRYYVELYEGGERLDLFRIMPTTAKRSADGQTITYQCEHVLGTLIDDIMFQFHTVGGLGVYTDDVISYILSKQSTTRWQLGAVAFSRQFEYNWENENLLNALRSVPGPFVDEWMWSWDTSSYPWKLNLVEPPNEVDAYIRYGVNLRGIEKQIDPRNLCTRLYGLGYGEGVNQLNFANINDGLPYIDSDTQEQFGLISDVFVDRRFEHPETLKARVEAILNERKVPRISYSVDAADLSQITDVPIHKFTSGGQVRVIDQELGVDIIARVVNKRKSDMRGQPGDVQLEISNKQIDIAGLFNQLETKQRINDLYAQGATNWDSHDFADNCDPTHPAVLRFFVPADTARINKVSLSYESESFRAYSKAIEGGGAATISSAGGGASVPSTSTASSTIQSSQTADEWTYTSFVPDAVSTEGLHGHNIPDGTELAKVGGGSVTFRSVSPFAGSHSHILEANHKHNVTIPAHNHTVNIPSHTHGITLPDHTHGIQYGIFEGTTPTVVTVKVDGNIIPGLGINDDDINLINYLSKDSEGRVTRGSWHTIEIAPDKLGRIVASVQIQLFVQSRGGGNY